MDIKKIKRLEESVRIYEQQIKEIEENIRFDSAEISYESCRDKIGKYYKDSSGLWKVKTAHLSLSGMRIHGMRISEGDGSPMGITDNDWDDIPCDAEEITSKEFWDKFDEIMKKIENANK